MRSLGIDYGKKRIGLALSDEGGTFALPYKVIPRSAIAAKEIAKICAKEDVSLIVLGESKKLNGEENPIMADIRSFAAELAGLVSLPIEYQPEYFSSAEAERSGLDEDLDARAAALILQSYLDRPK